MPVTLKIETIDEEFVPYCDCCGTSTRRVWGRISTDLGSIALYFVHWSPGNVTSKNPARFDLIIEQRGETATTSDGVAVSVLFQVGEEGPGFMVVDANKYPIAKSELVGKALAREEVIGTPLAQVVFDCLDAIWLQDPRIQDLDVAS